MAQIRTVTLIDDLDETPADETVSFGLDGRAYEIDLSEKNATKLREALEDFVASARRAGKTTSSRSTSASRPTTDREQTAAIRAWAKMMGHQISDRGRIPSNIVQEFHQSGGKPAKFSDPDPVPGIPWKQLDADRKAEVKAWAAHHGIDSKAWVMNSKFRDRMAELCLNNDEKAAKAEFHTE